MIWRRTRLFLAAFLVLFMTAPVAQAVTERTGAAFFIQDDANILSASEEAELARLGEELERYTTAQVVLKTVPDLKGQDLSTYANETFRAQGIGQEGADNGVLVVVAPNETSRNFRIEVGYKMEGIITDTTAGRILDENAVPYRETGEWNKAAAETYKAVVSVVSKEQPLEASDPAPQSEGGLSFWTKVLIGAGLVLLIFLDMKFTGGMFFFAILNILSSVLRGGGGGGGSRGGGGSSGGGGAER